MNECNRPRFYESILKYLDKHKLQARLLIMTFCFGFIIVALGVAVNLACSQSVFGFVKVLINFLVK